MNNHGKAAGSPKWWRANSAHDLKSLENVEKHLRAQLEVELHKKSGRDLPGRRPGQPDHASHPEVERRVNRLMQIEECFPGGNLVLKGTLSPLMKTLESGTYRAFLRSRGQATAVLYINFERKICLTASLVPYTVYLLQ